MSPLARLCATRGCTTTITTGTRCPTHAHLNTQAKNRRDTPAKNQRPHRRIYQDPRWKVTRNIVIARANHQCEICGAPATIADHYPYPVLDLIVRHLDPYDFAFCRALCHQCSGHHDGKRSHLGTPKTEQTTGTPTTLLA